MQIYINRFLIVFSFALFQNCVDPGPSSNSGNNQPADTTTVVSPPPPAEPQKPKCELDGTMLDGNSFWAKDKNAIIRIVATEETKDEELGDSHRILEVYDGNSCELVKKEILPINQSPDFPYYLSEITYNKSKNIIAIRGFDQIFCYDIGTQELLNGVKPLFINERFGEDASSGMIKRLEVWENYLIGYSQGFGSFVFDLSSQQPTPVEPFAEFAVVRGEEYNSMFLLKSKDDKYQPILPSFDLNNNTFSINPILSEPKSLVDKINRRFRDNQYIILKEIISETEQKPIAVDMKTRTKIDLPEEIAGLKNTEIIDWLKKQ